MRPSPETVAASAAAVLLLLLAAGAAAGLVALMAAPSLQAPLRSLPSNTWWLIYRETSGTDSSAALRIAAAIAATLVSIPAILRLAAVGRRVSSPIAAFLSLFLASVGIECFRAAIMLLFAGDGSIQLSVLLTRVIYWGRFVGLLAVLLVGLYNAELKYGKTLVLGGVVLLVAFAMAAYIPVDRTVFLAQLTWKLGDEQGVWFLDLAVAVLAVAAGVLAAVTRRGQRTRRIALAVVFLVVARELQFFALAPIPLAAGIVAQIVGAVAGIRALSVTEDGTTGRIPGGRSAQRQP